jgi:sortase A
VRRVRWVKTAAALVLAGGVALLARGAYVAVKGRVASVLIDTAWSARLRDGRPHPPWPWADFVPVARLQVPRLRIDRPILSDATGRTLAFGLGHLGGTAPPGVPGRCVVAGHRDSWAAFLRGLRRGDVMVVRAAHGERRYTVTELRVVDRREAGVVREEAATDDAGDASGGDALVLITCWPFGGLRSGPLRYIVVGGPPPD